MLSLFSFLGKSLDSSRVTLPDRPEYDSMRSQYSSILGGFGWLILLLAISLSCLLWVWFRATHPIPTSFFLAQQTLDQQSKAQQAQDGSSTAPARLVASLNPKMSSLRAQRWLSNSLMDIFTLNFVNADQNIADAHWNFRPDTYELFRRELYKKGGVVSSVKSNRLEMYLTPITDVRVTQTGKNGQYRLWKMEMQGLLIFSGSTQEKAPIKEVSFFVLLEEVPTTQNPAGLSIAQISMK